MVYTCCVPNCRGNYPNSPKVQTFSFPNDEGLKTTWLRAIRRENFVPTQYSKVCREHFADHDIISEAGSYDPKSGEKLTYPLKRPRLREGAVPSRFPNCPQYLSSQICHREGTDQRRERIENENMRTAIEKSLKCKADYDAKKKFATFAEFIDCVNAEKVPDCWTIIIKSDCVLFLLLEAEPAPMICSSVVMNKDLECSLFIGKTKLRELGKQSFPKAVNDINELTGILKHLHAVVKPTIADTISHVIDSIVSILKDVCDDSDNHKMLSFFVEQLQLLNCKKNSIRYSPDMAVFFSILYSVSPHAYRFCRSSGYLIMPHPRTIQKICSSYSTDPAREQTEERFLSYIKQKFAMLDSSDLKVILMLDEIHIKPYIDYKGGNIVGAAYNTSNAATTVHAFMVKSLLSSFKEVVHILPVRSLSASDLHIFIKKVIVGLHGIGFHVICVVSDNNSINRKAMTYFRSPPEVNIVYPHPCIPKAPLFFIIDSVHIFKCIRNNWVNQKNGDQGMYYPHFEDVNKLPLACASFKTLKSLHEIEMGCLVKYAHGLSLKSLYPSNLEKQNVKLVQNIFNRFLVEALLSIGKKHGLLNCESTAEFITLIFNWWSVVNVKTPLKGQRFCDPLQEPIISCSQKNVQFLEKFLFWLDEWKAKNCTTGTLTKETHFAITHTTYGLLEMSKYCLEELNFSYFLPGKLQTDSLEERFGKYRSLAGSQYLVSVRQIFECESKLRMQNFKPILKLQSSTFGSIETLNIDVSDLSNGQNDNEIHDNFDIYVIEEDFKTCEESLPVITYLSGYCAYAALKKLQCEACSKLMVLDKKLELGSDYNLIRNMDRGGLLYPSPDVVNAVLYNYIVIQKLMTEQNESRFLKENNQRQLAVALTIAVISEQEFFLMDDVCENEHSSSFVLKLVVTASTNCILKNYCAQRNDNKKPVPKRRKHKTLEKP